MKAFATTCVVLSRSLRPTATLRVAMRSFSATAAPATGGATPPPASVLGTPVAKVDEIQGGVYTRDLENDLFRTVTFPTDDATAPHLDKEWRTLVNTLFEKHRPSKHSFFKTLKTAPKEVATNPGYLSELYLRYQAAMHITRAMVWYAPHLDDPVLRQRKIAIIADDDALNGKASHHKQLENMFVRFGAKPLPESAFGERRDLAKVLDPETMKFVDTVTRLYPATTGAWCIAEVLSDDWLSSLADSLSAHFTKVTQEQYFDEVFSGHVEVIHMMTTTLLTEEVMFRHPEKRQLTFAHAREMCEALDNLWANLENLTKNPGKYLSK